MFSGPFFGNGVNVQVGYGARPIALVVGGVIGTQLFPPRFVLCRPFCGFSTVFPFCLRSWDFVCSSFIASYFRMGSYQWRTACDAHYLIYIIYYAGACNAPRLGIGETRGICSPTQARIRILLR